MSHYRKRYWGQHIWARGYWVATTGNVTEEMIREYLENQTKPPVSPQDEDLHFKII